MAQLASGFIPLGRHVAHVQTTAETVRKSYYRVDGIRRGTGWFPGEVTVNAASVFACLTCLTNACIHIDAVQKFLAGQPLEPIPVIEVVACTGVAARWCPIHGNCTNDPEVGAEDSFEFPYSDHCSDRDCPLHGQASTHAQPLDTTATGGQNVGPGR